MNGVKRLARELKPPAVEPVHPLMGKLQQNQPIQEESDVQHRTPAQYMLNDLRLQTGLIGL